MKSSVDILNEVAIPENLSFELVGLSRARNYQEWVFRAIRPYLGERVLEIGAGIGNMSRWIPVGDRLVLTEADAVLLSFLQKNLSPQLAADPRVSVQSFDLLKDDLTAMKVENFDTIISFNVLEHVEDDLKAIERLADLLRRTDSPGPRRLVTFVPAHPWAYGSMDKTFGHYRRYSRSALREIAEKAAPDARHSFRYFNFFGLIGWIIQGRILRKGNLGTSSIAAFERLCPILSPLDDFIHATLHLPIGQSLLWVAEWPRP